MAESREEPNWGERVRKRREERRMSQYELAEVIGTTQATIDKIERGISRRSRFLPAVFSVLDLPLDELAAFQVTPKSGSPNPPPSQEAFEEVYRSLSRADQQLVDDLARSLKARAPKRRRGT